MGASGSVSPDRKTLPDESDLGKCGTVGGEWGPTFLQELRECRGEIWREWRPTMVNGDVLIKVKKIDVCERFREGEQFP